MASSKQHNNHRYIALSAPAITRPEAETRVMAALAQYGVSKSLKDLKSTVEVLTLKDGHGRVTTTNFPDLVAGVMNSGVVPEIDRMRWRDTDKYGSVSVATEAPLPIALGAGPRTSAPLNGPGCGSNDVTADMLDDILFYRQEVVRLSTYQDQFKPCFRAYRSYHASCITAVDSFLSRCAWFALNDPATKLAASERFTLEAFRKSIVWKLKTWVPILMGGGVLDKKSQAWVDFNALREARNGYVHVNEPDYVFSLAVVPDTLNLCRQGVGQLITDVLSLGNLNPHPSVVAVRHAPTASFVPK